MNLMIMLPDSMRAEGDALAAMIAATLDVDSVVAESSFDRLPRVSIKGTLMRWGTLGPNESAKVLQALPDIDSPLLADALRISGIPAGELPPDVSARMVLAIDADPRELIAWLQMVELPAAE